jgi:uncharacterized repeat protein (TIGR03803 family)
VNPKSPFTLMLLDSLRSLSCATLLIYALTVLPGGTLQAQTFTVIHSFGGGLGGSNPVAGLIEDARGNLYGTTTDGVNGPGDVYRLTRVQAGWALSALTQFGQNGQDGYLPLAGLTLGPDGMFYGTNNSGGGGAAGGAGTVYRLNPATNSSHTVIYRFSGPDGYRPLEAEVTFDRAGNMFGTTSYGGSKLEGTVFELIRNGNQWTQSVIYNFSGLLDGGEPDGGLLFDSAGNLYGTTLQGGDADCSCGVVYELSPSAGSWSIRVLHIFDGATGRWPEAGLIMDSAGNLYGTTTGGGPSNGGTVFELSPAGNQWNFSTIHTFYRTGMDGESGPEGPVLLDAAGNLYGATHSDGAYGQGAVFKLTPTNGEWGFTSLHDFQSSPDGSLPYGNLVMDASGNIYGTTYEGGAYGLGTVWEIMP